ncbi:TGF-beta-activated kinase 1 and MAP3K7-binding protein 3-like isoform X2 [Periplaneta americana]|uniref:TGF-beta-activated kinase 1 and MAP3K7-binding protein 3-like isoform X2 n=1 Tax=Periplaneta americana TaxID=6978 RepID=UPI0037E7E152
MADCDSGCSNISIMQLFHELKQKFPAVPDRVVSECIRKNSHDKNACEEILRRENQGYLLHSYPVALKMSAEPAPPPTASLCDQALVRQNRPSNFEFLTNVVGGGSGGAEVRDRTVSVVTYHSGEQRRDNYEVNVNYSTSPSTRVRSALQVSPSPHYLCPPPQQARSYTSVNLTLRPPSSEPQPPIDISSAGSSLTYSTCSYDPRQGYQSQLQIRIGPGGVGSVSALRTQTSPAPPYRQEEHQQELWQLEDGTGVTMHELVLPSTRSEYGSREKFFLEYYTEALLRQQLERKNKLQKELYKEKENLRAMQREVQEMRRDLEQRQRRKQTLSLPVVSTVKVQELRLEIQKLQEECKKMTHEVDLSMDARVPLGETDEEFYKNIYTGQRGFIFPPAPPPPPRPNTGSRRGLPTGDSVDGPHWTCTECTFQNHPLLDKCETCEMPRIVLAGGEMQDIHIHVTHHNFPARRKHLTLRGHSQLGCLTVRCSLCRLSTRRSWLSFEGENA